MAKNSGDGAKKAPTVVRYYRFKNRLKEKTLGLGGGTGAVSAEALQKAQEALESMAEDYPDWVNGLISELNNYHGRCVDTPEKRHDCFAEMHRIAHDMQGQGGTFGYPLISSFAESLHSFTLPTKNEITDNMVELVKAHIDSMRAVIRGRVSGDGGKIGTELQESLNQAIDRYKNRTTEDVAEQTYDYAYQQTERE
jgi:HPt (histidine-containing phosphotransfer) domain-containing protein